MILKPDLSAQVVSPVLGGSHFPDKLNQTIGTLRVIELLGLNKYQHRVYRCICEVCHTERQLDNNRLNYLANKGCRCRRGRLEDLRFGRLWVLFKCNLHAGKNRKYVCLCKCGTFTKATSSDLLGEGKRSCGCLAREAPNHALRGKPSKNRKPYGYSAFRRLYLGYKQKATSRRFGFDLTEDQAQQLFKANCHYCGVEPKQIVRVKPTKHYKMYGNYIYNGIDRLDSSQGYFLGNVVTACGKCNVAKMETPYSEFVEWIRRAHNHLQSQGIYDQKEVA